eukprot:7777390-Lingulodinium_polyedra.AAC.1
MSKLGPSLGHTRPPWSKAECEQHIGNNIARNTQVNIVQGVKLQKEDAKRWEAPNWMVTQWMSPAPRRCVLVGHPKASGGEIIPQPGRIVLMARAPTTHLQ